MQGGEGGRRGREEIWREAIATREAEIVVSRVSSGESRISPRLGRQHTLLPNFPKNCMKLKKFGPQGRGHPKFTM